ncbi:MAG: hypothetical protein UX72_C0050G0001, partial [Parcubacteria group bacterium GW2011_GWA2_47_10]
HEYLQIAVLSWLKYEMPVIRHDAVGKNTHAIQFFGFSKNCFKKLIVLVCMKNLRAGVRTVDDMIDEITDVYSWGAWHTLSVARMRLLIKGS